MNDFSKKMVPLPNLEIGQALGKTTPRQRRFPRCVVEISPATSFLCPYSHEGKVFPIWNTSSWNVTNEDLRMLMAAILSLLLHVQVPGCLLAKDHS